jgi:alanine-glyoxylate transaminase/serine-glyoxylate transaminase/serine-pyruvate transaminase
MTAPRYPAGVNGADFLARAAKAGVTLAGGLHPAIRAEYFRIGHMGSVNLGDILATIAAVETALNGTGFAFAQGSGVAAALRSSISD